MQNSKTYTKIKNESMNIQKAIQRIEWRFKNENVKINESKITINELDVNAVEFLVEWINNQKRESLTRNELFAKFYVYSLENELEFYKDVEFATKRLTEVASQPIENRYDKIHEKLNKIAYKSFCKEKGIIIDHIEKLTLKFEQEQEQKELIKQNEYELKKHALGLLDKSKVFKQLNNLISETINKFK